MNQTEIVDKYRQVLNDINLGIEKFNKLLSVNNQVKAIETDRLIDDTYFHTLNGKTWQQISFPLNNGYAGVYFYFGYSTIDKNDILVYVGKASLSSTTGQRLYSHFIHSFDEEKKAYKINNSTKYIIEGTFVIPFDKTETVCLAPALEEFLIVELSRQKKYTMDNVNGR